VYCFGTLYYDGFFFNRLDENTSSKVMFVNSEEELCKYLIPDILPDDI